MVPTRREVLLKLRALADGSLAPDEASGWATPWVAERVTQARDPVVVRGLHSLYMADALTAPGTLLYGPSDYAQWLEDYVVAMTASTSRHTDVGATENGAAPNGT